MPVRSTYNWVHLLYVSKLTRNANRAAEGSKEDEAHQEGSSLCRHHDACSDVLRWKASFFGCWKLGRVRQPKLIPFVLGNIRCGRFLFSPRKSVSEKVFWTVSETLFRWIAWSMTWCPWQRSRDTMEQCAPWAGRASLTVRARGRLFSSWCRAVEYHCKIIWSTYFQGCCCGGEHGVMHVVRFAPRKSATPLLKHIRSDDKASSRHPHGCV